jgi:carbon storage regulator CsrA
MAEIGNVVLSRRLHESFWIGDAEVKVVEVRGSSRVKLRISAPRDVPVSRFPPEERINRTVGEVVR